MDCSGGRLDGVCYGVDAYNQTASKESVQAIRATANDVDHVGGILMPAAFMGGQGAKAHGIGYCNDGTTPTLKAAPSGGNTVPDVCYPINTMVATRGGRDDMRTCFGIGEPSDPQFTLCANHEHAVCYCLQGNGIDRADTAGCNGAGWRQGESYTLNTIDRQAVAYDARGFGDRANCPTMTHSNVGHIGDLTPIVTERVKDE